MNDSSPVLLFVYNADSGLFNAMADIGHKIFSPATYSCDLCALTHGYFRERKQWRKFIESLEMECEFLHRDQFLEHQPETTTDLPAIFIRDGGEIRPCVTAEQLRDCKDLDGLQQLILSQCTTRTE